MRSVVLCEVFNIMVYINFYFKNITYNEQQISGDFLSPDVDVSCSFSYNRLTQKCELRNNSKPLEEIEPLPIYWLLNKLEENGTLKTSESKISY